MPPAAAYNLGGQKGGTKLTDLAITMARIKYYLMTDRQWHTIADIADNVATHWANPKASIAQQLRFLGPDPAIESKLVKGRRYYRIKEGIAYDTYFGHDEHYTKMLHITDDSPDVPAALVELKQYLLLKPDNHPYRIK